ncbi:LPXTG cell wall anchor domain-containing protein, partial [Xanthomonas citri pv. citri]|nr:LPXTG cell wall anchor domain-containing protein [Xanthomonas citri pv. citri]
DNGSEITFTVSSNAIQTAMAEAGSISWIIILIIVIVVLIIAGIVIFLVRKKKKDNN